MTKIKAFAGLLLLWAVACLSAGGNPCKCADDWSWTIRRKIRGFKNLPPMDPYEYTGSIVGILNSYFRPCVCDDVLRVTTTISIQSADLYDETANVNKIEAETNVTETLIDLFPLMDWELDYRMADVTASFVSRTAPTETTFDLEFVIRGSNQSLAELIPASLAYSPYDIDVTENVLPNLGTFTLTPVQVKTCSGEPPPSPDSSITLNWMGAVVPPTRADYECAEGNYIIPYGVGWSVCDHDTLQWTSIPSMACTPGCGLDPPSVPMFGDWSWNDTERDIGHEVTYSCWPGYKSGDGDNATSVCEKEGWEELPLTFYCAEKPCPDSIPQVVSHATSTFIQNRYSAGTVVTYSCIEHYRPSTQQSERIKCKLGEWEALPRGWHCINVNSLSPSDTLTGEMEIPLNELTSEELYRREELQVEQPYFWVVTIPSMIGLNILVLTCLCCTRTDSPLYYMCGGYRPPKQQKQVEIKSTA